MKREISSQDRKAEFVSKLFVFFSIARYTLLLRIYRIFFFHACTGNFDIVEFSCCCHKLWWHLSAFTQGFDITQRCWGGFCWLWPRSDLNTFCQTPDMIQELHTGALFSSVLLVFPGHRNFKIRLIRIEGLFLSLCLWDWYWHQHNNHLKIPLISGASVDLLQVDTSVLNNIKILNKQTRLLTYF